MTLALSLLVLGGVVFCGAAMWFGLIRGWANLNEYTRYQCLSMPWMSLEVIVLIVPSLTQRLLGTELPATILSLQDPLTFLIVGIAFSVGWLRWPTWAMPPWFRVLEERRRLGRE